MSTRWYPIYQKGNPQLRVFLPNFWLKIVQPELNQPKNVVTFNCSMEMTKFDIQNYLSKIYDVHPVDVRTRIRMGKVKRGPEGRFVKEPDVKIAYAILKRDQTFTFPDLFPSTGDTKRSEEYKQNIQKSIKESIPTDADPGQVTWFSG